MQRLLPFVRLVTSLVPVVLAVALIGCAKKAVETPPEQTPAPPQPAPSPTPTPTPPSPPAFSAADLQPVFFDFDSYTLRDDARAALDADAKLLRDNSTAHIVIEGHCDERGTVEYNQALGERRAQAAKDYLVQLALEPLHLLEQLLGRAARRRARAEQDVALLLDLLARLGERLVGERVAYVHRVDDRTQAVEPRADREERRRRARGQAGEHSCGCQEREDRNDPRAQPSGGPDGVDVALGATNHCSAKCARRFFAHAASS